MSKELVWNRFSMRTVFHVSLANENDIFLSVCNVTVSSAGVGSQSGLNFGEIKSSPGIRGPVSCYFRSVSLQSVKSHLPYSSNSEYWFGRLQYVLLRVEIRFKYGNRVLWCLMSQSNMLTWCMMPFDVNINFIQTCLNLQVDTTFKGYYKDMKWQATRHTHSPRWLSLRALSCLSINQ